MIADMPYDVNIVLSDSVSNTMRMYIFRGSDYPFTAPIVRPETKYFWKKG